MDFYTNINQLPPEILMIVASCLDLKSILSCRLVNKLWESCMSERLWDQTITVSLMDAHGDEIRIGSKKLTMDMLDARTDTVKQIKKYNSFLVELHVVWSVLEIGVVPSSFQAALNLTKNVIAPDNETGTKKRRLSLHIPVFLFLPAKETTVYFKQKEVAVLFESLVCRFNTLSSMSLSVGLDAFFAISMMGQQSRMTKFKTVRHVSFSFKKDKQSIQTKLVSSHQLKSMLSMCPNVENISFVGFTANQLLSVICKDAARSFQRLKCLKKVKIETSEDLNLLLHCPSPLTELNMSMARFDQNLSEEKKIVQCLEDLIRKHAVILEDLVLLVFNFSVGSDPFRSNVFLRLVKLSLVEFFVREDVNTEGLGLKLCLWEGSFAATFPVLRRLSLYGTFGPSSTASISHIFPIDRIIPPVNSLRVFNCENICEHSVALRIDNVFPCLAEKQVNKCCRYI